VLTRRVRQERLCSIEGTEFTQFIRQFGSSLPLNYCGECGTPRWPSKPLAITLDGEAPESRRKLRMCHLAVTNVSINPHILTCIYWIPEMVTGPTHWYYLLEGSIVLCRTPPAAALAGKYLPNLTICSIILNAYNHTTIDFKAINRVFIIVIMSWARLWD